MKFNKSMFILTKFIISNRFHKMKTTGLLFFFIPFLLPFSNFYGEHNSSQTLDSVNQSTATTNSCLEADSLALVAIYEATGGREHWKYNFTHYRDSFSDRVLVDAPNAENKWLEGPIADWHGVQLSEDGCRVERLILYNMNLQGEVPDLDQLQVLFLSSNYELKQLPQMTRLEKLTHLDISRTRLDSLPSLEALTNLRFLHCSNGRLDSIPSLDQLHKLEKLKCDNNSLKDLSGLTQLNNLIILDCSNNPLTTIPLDNLTNLKELYCDDGNLTNLNSIVNLSKLEKLYCENNPLYNLPNLDKLVNLQELNCSNDSLSILPSLDNLSQLTEFNCSDNLLSTIENLNSLTKLQYLYCNNNQLSNLSSLDELTELEELECQDNQLTSLPALPNSNQLTIFCENNQLSFKDLENPIKLVNKSIISYSPQSTIPIYQKADTFYVKAGGTLSDNTYAWFRDGVPINAIHGDSTFIPTSTGAYYCIVSHYR